MLRQPIRDQADDRPQSWLVLATARLADQHAEILALAESGNPTSKPSKYRTLSSADEAEAWLRELDAGGELAHAAWTYTVFRAE